MSIKHIKPLIKKRLTTVQTQEKANFEPKTLVGVQLNKTINGLPKKLEVLLYVRFPGIKSSGIPYDYYIGNEKNNQKLSVHDIVTGDFPYGYFVVGVKIDPDLPSKLGENVSAVIGIPENKMISIIHDPSLLNLK